MKVSRHCRIFQRVRVSYSEILALLFLKHSNVLATIAMENDGSGVSYDLC